MCCHLFIDTDTKIKLKHNTPTSKQETLNFGKSKKDQLYNIQTRNSKQEICNYINEVKYFQNFSSFLDKYFFDYIIKFEKWRVAKYKRKKRNQISAHAHSVSFPIAPLFEIIEFICRSGKEKKKEQEMFG